MVGTRQFSWVVMACIFVALLPGCWGGSVARSDFLVINVLDNPDCLIKGSINVPFADFESYIQKQLSAGAIDKETEIVVYCSNYMCSASGASWQYLSNQGFANIWAYEAGMAAWYQAGLPVEGACKSAYLTGANEPLGAHDSKVRTISTDELKKKMDDHADHSKGSSCCGNAGHAG